MIFLISYFFDFFLIPSFFIIFYFSYILYSYTKVNFSLKHINTTLFLDQSVPFFFFFFFLLSLSIHLEYHKQTKTHTYTLT